MPKPINHERSKTVVLLKDKKGLSFRDIAKTFNLAVSTVHEIYTLQKARSGLTNSRKPVRV